MKRYQGQGSRSGEVPVEQGSRIGVVPGAAGVKRSRGHQEWSGPEDGLQESSVSGDRAAEVERFRGRAAGVEPSRRQGSTGGAIPVTAGLKRSR